MGTLGRWLCGLGVASLLLGFSVEVEARGGEYRGRSVSRAWHQPTIPCGPALHPQGWALYHSPLAVTPKQGVARQLVHQTERESLHRKGGVSHQSAAKMRAKARPSPLLHSDFPQGACAMGSGFDILLISFSMLSLKPALRPSSSPASGSGRVSPAP
jgi:hypothetical protein